MVAKDLNYGRLWQQEFRKTPEGKAHTRRMNLRAKGVTPEWYDSKLQEQNGACAVCGKTDPGSNQYSRQSFCVDHNHQTGEARGLLCHNCNRAEGLLNGNAQNLADYLRKYNEG